MFQLSHLYMTTGNTIALTIQTFVGKVRPLLFNMLSSLITTFLPRSKCLLISWLQSPSALVLEPKKIKSPKNWCFWTVVLEKTLESPLDCKEIQPVHSKGDRSWVFFWRNDAKAETPVLWPPHVKSWLIGKDSDAGRDWGQEEKGTKEDEMAGWHHWLNEREFGWTPGVGDGQGGLVCCDSWGCKESDMTEWLNWTDLPPEKSVCRSRGNS